MIKGLGMHTEKADDLLLVLMTCCSFILSHMALDAAFTKQSCLCQAGDNLEPPFKQSGFC